jgi:hypothetical protein
VPDINFELEIKKGFAPSDFEYVNGTLFLI